MKVYLADAFADRLFAGNPAAVCVLPEWLSDDAMQRIAEELHLSETAFLVRSGDRYAIRWFTPEYEIDLCGHATLASAFVLHRFFDPRAKYFRFDSRSGALNVAVDDEFFTLDFPSRPPVPADAPEGLEAALGISVTEIYRSRDLMIVTDCEETVRGLDPDFVRLRKIGLGDGVIVTASGRDCDFVSRCFYPKCGVNEDPVTGSAHCNLIPYWAKRLGKTELFARQLSKRGGTLRCADRGERVAIGGKAVLFAACDVLIDP